MKWVKVVHPFFSSQDNCPGTTASSVLHFQIIIFVILTNALIILLHECVVNVCLGDACVQISIGRDGTQRASSPDEPF